MQILKRLWKKVQGCKDKEDKSWTENTSVHNPCGYASLAVGSEEALVKGPNLYRGPDTVKHLLISVPSEERPFLKAKEQSRTIKISV